MKGMKKDSERMLHEIEASQLPDNEFKAVVIRKLNELTENLLGTVLPGFRNCNPSWLRLSKKTLGPEAT